MPKATKFTSHDCSIASASEDAGATFAKHLGIYPPVNRSRTT